MKGSWKNETLLNSILDQFLNQPFCRKGVWELMCAREVVESEAGLAFAAAVWRCLQGYTRADAGKDTVPWVINLLSSENASFLMCPWPLTSPPGLLWQPVGGDVPCKLG